ncbi:MAG: TRAP transporter small permease [Firmicutes bacterium]|nr:TRAP transporter small permease [Bacillota bacterium]
MWQKILATVQRTLELLVIVSMAATTVVVLIGVFCRYILASSLPWTEELSRYLLVWIGFLAAPIAMRRGAHVGMQFIKLMLPERIRYWTSLMGSGMVLVFLGFVFVQGLNLLVGVAGQLSPAMSLPMTWAYAAIPTGCFFMALEVLGLLTFALRSVGDQTQEQRTDGRVLG